MRLKTIQIVAGLGSAIAFVLAFMAAGALMASLVFALIGAGLLAWVLYGVSRVVFARQRANEALPDDGRRPLPPTTT
ncbi:MAG: hypothetical protein K2X25_03220 [Caulobacteraceae bacterium]|nr:hypothetical protein [Caulobacteraceae bacterium]